MSIQHSQQKGFGSPTNNQTQNLNLDTPSQQLNQDNFQFVDQFTFIFEFFATYIDKKFNEMQEFMQLYNKSVQMSNKNFLTIAQVVFFKNPLENLPLYKIKKNERKLQDDLQAYIKRINDAKEELIKQSNVQRHNQISLDSLKESSNFNINLMQSHNYSLKQSQESVRSDKKSPPSSKHTSNIVTFEHEEQEEEEQQDIVRSLRKNNKFKEQKRNKSVQEESEVQDDSDTELRRKVMIGNLEGFSQQRIQNNNNIVVDTSKRVMTVGSSEGDTEGEIITIGEEMGLEQAKLTNKKMIKNKTSRSPLRSAKNQTAQNKHQTKKSPLLSKYDQLSKELQLDNHSSNETHLNHTNPKFTNSLHQKSGENQPKSPFAYIQKQSMSKYHNQQTKPSQVSQSFNSTQNLSKNLSRSKPQSKSKGMRTKSNAKSKSPTRNSGTLQTPSNNGQGKVQSSTAHFLTHKHKNDHKINNHFSSLQNSVQSTFRENNLQENKEPLIAPLQSSSGGSSTKLFESLQGTKGKINVSQSLNFNYPQPLNPQLTVEQQAQKVPSQSPVPLTTTVEDKEEEKEVKNFQLLDKQKEDEAKETIETETEQNFEENLKKVNGGVTGETDQIIDGHRFTLQGEGQHNISSKTSSVRNSNARIQNKIQSVKDIPGETQTFEYAPQLASEAQIQILTQENLFSPTGQQIPIDFDLAQYNSPSFAAGHHMYSYTSLQKQLESVKNTSSSSGKEFESSYCLQLNYDQKIILDNQMQKRANRTGFLKLPGEVLCLIGEYLNEKLPIFIFTNRISFKVCLQYQIEFYEQQRQIMFNQMGQLQSELEMIQKAKKFDLSTQSRDEYESIEEDNWQNLIMIIRKQSENPAITFLKQKDIIILRLYLTFMGLDLAEEVEDKKFLYSASDFLKDCGDQISQLMDPERSFLISEDNKQRIKELLVNLQREKLMEEEGKNEQAPSEAQQGLKVIEIFTNLLFEALQFVNIIPNVLVNDMKQEIEELKKVGEAFNGIKNNLIDFKNLVA